jgi:hypothetical protein
MQRMSAGSSNISLNNKSKFGSVNKHDNTTKTVIRQKTSVTFIDRPNTSRKLSRKNINARFISIKAFKIAYILKLIIT